MTLATVVLDVYGDADRRDVFSAIKKLTGRIDGLSTYGVYCYWAPRTREVLYVGLAGDLARRFGQHNGLVGREARGDKREQIDAWFREHDILGVGLLTQSSAVAILESVGLDTSRSITQDAEGQLIAAHEAARGAKPPWNGIGGSRHGAANVTSLTAGWFDLLSGTADSLLVARRTIRELATSEDDYQREMTLHGARLNALHERGLASEGVDDADIKTWLGRLLTEPRWGGDPTALVDLATSGYVLLDQPFGGSK